MGRIGSGAVGLVNVPGVTGRPPRTQACSRCGNPMSISATDAFGEPVFECQNCRESEAARKLAERRAPAAAAELAGKREAWVRYQRQREEGLENLRRIEEAKRPPRRPGLLARLRGGR